MKHRRFVVALTVVMFLTIGVIAGLALYSTMAVKASVPALPDSIAYLPADSQAVFGMNVRKFIDSPVYQRWQEKHGAEIGKDLAEFTARTGVDPRRDISYIIAAGRSAEERKGTGVLIAQGSFDTTAITGFINTQATAPIKLDYDGATVFMIPEKSGSTLEKGIAFLSEKEIVLGELGALKQVLDIRNGRNKQSVLDNPTLGPLIRDLNSDEMFWFAGDPANVLAKAPANTPFGGNLSSIKNVFGTLNLTSEVAGVITVTAKDAESAGKLADVVKGLLALGSLASDQNPNLAQLLAGVRIEQILNANTKVSDQIRLKINFPIDLLDKLEPVRPAAAAKKVA